MYFTKSDYIFVNKYGILRVLYRIFDRCSAIFCLHFLIMKEQSTSDGADGRVN